jgi:tyrosyl-tRNA synthetase
MTLKMKLAREIVSIYHDGKKAIAAEQEFMAVFSKKELPEDIETKTLAIPDLNIVELLSITGLAPSKSEARRLIEQGGVKIDGKKVTTHESIISLKKELLIQVGKRKFLRVKAK